MQHLSTRGQSSMNYTDKLGFQDTCWQTLACDAPCNVWLLKPLQPRADPRSESTTPPSRTYVVEAARCQALGEVCGEQEACEEGQGNVVVVEDVGVVVRASFSYAHEDLWTQHPTL